MTKAIQRSICLPFFSGYYNSLLSSAIDQQEEMFAEHEADERELEQPEHLRLTQEEIGSILFDVTRYHACYVKMTEYWVDAFEGIATEALEFPVKLTFDAVDSPREYNFTTDRAFAFIGEGTVRRLFAMSKADKHATLARLIKGHFTSYDGFYSSYPNALSAWLAKPLADWDHNELMTLLEACMALKGYTDDETPSGEGMRFQMYYAATEGEGDYQAWDHGVDWARYDEKVTEARADKQAEWDEENPGEEPPRYRCPSTPDLFAWAGVATPRAI